MAVKTPPGAQLSRKQWAHLKLRLTLSTVAMSVSAMLLFSVILINGELLGADTLVVSMHFLS